MHRARDSSDRKGWRQRPSCCFEKLPDRKKEDTGHLHRIESHEPISENLGKGVLDWVRETSRAWQYGHMFAALSHFEGPSPAHCVSV
jgi:hypothetical protein